MGRCKNRPLLLHYSLLCSLCTLKWHPFAWMPQSTKTTTQPCSWPNKFALSCWHSFLLYSDWNFVLFWAQRPFQYATHDLVQSSPVMERQWLTGPVLMEKFHLALLRFLEFRIQVPGILACLEVLVHDAIQKVLARTMLIPLIHNWPCQANISSYLSYFLRCDMLGLFTLF